MADDQTEFALVGVSAPVCPKCGRIAEWSDDVDDFADQRVPLVVTCECGWQGLGVRAMPVPVRT